MRNRIELFLAGKGWNARHVGPHAASVVELFGTDTLPTVFTSVADAGTVAAAIGYMNPGVEVEVVEMCAHGIALGALSGCVVCSARPEVLR